MEKDFDCWKYVDGKLLELPNIDKLCEIIRAKFIDQVDINKRLSETNHKLISGEWEKEEMKRLKEENEDLRAQIRFGFGITQEEHDKIKEWTSSHEEKYTGAIGGRYEYRFFPTGIGVIGKIVDTINDESFTFQDLSNA